MFQTGIGNYGSPMSFRNMGAMPGMGSPQGMGGVRGMGQSNPYQQMLMQHLQQQMPPAAPQMGINPPQAQPMPGMGGPAVMPQQPQGGGVLGMPGMGMPQPASPPQAPGQLQMKPMGVGGGQPVTMGGGQPMKPAVMPQGGAQMPGMARPMGRM